MLTRRGAILAIMQAMGVTSAAYGQTWVVQIRPNKRQTTSIPCSEHKSPGGFITSFGDAAEETYERDGQCYRSTPLLRTRGLEMNLDELADITVHYQGQTQILTREMLWQALIGEER